MNSPTLLWRKTTGIFQITVQSGKFDVEYIGKYSVELKFVTTVLEVPS